MIGGFGGFFRGDMMGVPVPFVDTEEGDGAKIPHDTYQVYVNQRYVGDKELISQNEEITDVDRFLKMRGFDQFTTQLTGNRYTIFSNDAFQEEKMRENLQVYLQTR